MNLNYQHIRKRIRQERIAANLSQAELAELADVSPQYISHIETGRKKASLSTIVSIAEALSLPVDYFLTGQISSIQSIDLEIQSLFKNLNRYERKILLSLLYATKQILLENRWMQDS